jgi:hypothetical protein
MNGNETDSTRRTLLKVLGAAGVAGAGVAGTSGSAAAQQGSSIFKNVPIELEGESIQSSDLTATLNNLAVEGDDLLISGLVKGTYTTTDGTTERVNQQFSDFNLTSIVEPTLDSISAVLDIEGNGGECPVLTLDLGPLFLDLLGLKVDLAKIELDLTAVAGEGNLLGNLLCAVAGLLDP